MITITATQASQRLHSGAEIAFLDLREAGEFGEKHPLFAIPAPFHSWNFALRSWCPVWRRRSCCWTAGMVLRNAARRG